MSSIKQRTSWLIKVIGVVLVGKQDGIDWWELVELEAQWLSIGEVLVVTDFVLGLGRGEVWVGQEIDAVDSEDCGGGADVCHFDGGLEGRWEGGGDHFCGVGVDVLRLWSVRSEGNRKHSKSRLCWDEDDAFEAGKSLIEIGKQRYIL